MKKALILGAGVSGCTCAYMLRKKGFEVDIIEKTDSNKVEILKKYYKTNGLFEKSILSKDFIIYNQKAIDRVKIYMYLLRLFEVKNKELSNLLNRNLNEK